MIRYSIGILTLALALDACSPVMEANRPDPIDIKQFVLGENKTKVLMAIGSPLATTKEKGTDDDSEKSCDLYKLYTKGPDGVGKGAIAAGEIVADVLTLGLTEIVFTPVEAGTKNTKHTVTFCYDDDNKLVSIDQAEGATGE
jgi:hypothetical protein